MILLYVNLFWADYNIESIIYTNQELILSGTEGIKEW